MFDDEPVREPEKIKNPLRNASIRKEEDGRYIVKDNDTHREWTVESIEKAWELINNGPELHWWEEINRHGADVDASQFSRPLGGKNWWLP